jgi:hypothetical protein
MLSQMPFENGKNTATGAAKDLKNNYRYRMKITFTTLTSANSVYSYCKPSELLLLLGYSRL